jgi:hypothetical protein
MVPQRPCSATLDRRRCPVTWIKMRWRVMRATRRSHWTNNQNLVTRSSRAASNPPAPDLRRRAAPCCRKATATGWRIAASSPDQDSARTGPGNGNRSTPLSAGSSPRPPRSGAAGPDLGRHELRRAQDLAFLPLAHHARYGEKGTDIGREGGYRCCGAARRSRQRWPAGCDRSRRLEEGGEEVGEGGWLAITAAAAVAALDLAHSRRCLLSALLC